MRPVNLIPPEERHGQHSPLRTGPIAYVLLGVLLLAFAGVISLVLTNNEIADRKSEIAQLRHEDAVASARVQRLAAYTQFRTLSEQRVETVRSLADSRFDWERVMREFSLVLPADVWLTSLTATATPAVAVGGGAGSSSGGTLRAAVPGPALELNGCTRGQKGVAGFVTALKDIDGVTRVGVESSALPDVGSGAGTADSGGESGGSSTDCRTRGFIAQFKMVVAFDAAPVPIAAGSVEEAVPTATPEAAPEAASAESTPTAGEE
jgi:Tfp pilus assembly protein PilN